MPRDNIFFYQERLKSVRTLIISQPVAAGFLDSGCQGELQRQFPFPERGIAGLGRYVPSTVVVGGVMYPRKEAVSIAVRVIASWVGFLCRAFWQN